MRRDNWMVQASILAPHASVWSAKSDRISLSRFHIPLHLPLRVANLFVFLLQIMLQTSHRDILIPNYVQHIERNVSERTRVRAIVKVLFGITIDSKGWTQRAFRYELETKYERKKNREIPMLLPLTFFLSLSLSLLISACSLWTAFYARTYTISCFSLAYFHFGPTPFAVIASISLEGITRQRVCAPLLSIAGCRTSNCTEKP